MIDPHAAPGQGPIAVLSDVHANLEALTAVLADVDDVSRSLGPLPMVHLGDLVGYGPDPEACARLLFERGAVCVLGNHEKALRPKENPTTMNPVARDAINRTAAMLSEETAARLRSLPRSFTFHGCHCVHGCPPDSPTRYLHAIPAEVLPALFSAFSGPLCLCGHTHELKLYTFKEGMVVVSRLERGPRELDPAARHIINAGAVGQPRDGDPRAKYILLDPQAMTLDVRFVEYDSATTIEKLERLGFSKSLSVRLRG